MYAADFTNSGHAKIGSYTPQKRDQEPIMAPTVPTSGILHLRKGYNYKEVRGENCSNIHQPSKEFMIPTSKE